MNKNPKKVTVYETLHRFYKVEAWDENLTGDCDDIFSYFPDEKWNGPFYDQDNIDHFNNNKAILWSGWFYYLMFKYA